MYKRYEWHDQFCDNGHDDTMMNVYSSVEKYYQDNTCYNFLVIGYGIGLLARPTTVNGVGTEKNADLVKASFHLSSFAWFVQVC